MLARAKIFVLTLFAAATAAQAQSLLILSKHDHTLAIVDPATLEVKARVPVGNDPHEVIASADGTRAYVSNYGFGAFNTLAVVDLTSKQPLPAIDLGALRGPHGLVYVNGELYFTAEAAKAFGRYNPTTQQIDLILGTGQNRTHMIWVAPNVQTIVTTNVSSATVSVYTLETLRMPGPPPGARPPGEPNGVPPSGGPPPGVAPTPRKDWNQTVIPVGRGSEGFDVSPDRREVWVANAQDGTVSIVDLPGKKLLSTLNVDVPGANRLKFTPDGKLVLVSAGPNLVILDAHTRQAIKRIPIGHGSAGILIQPDGARAFIACGPDNNVAVLDLQTLTVTAHISAGGEPDGLAWAPAP
jgi:YVTN family beta-propeller protein